MDPQVMAHMAQVEREEQAREILKWLERYSNRDTVRYCRLALNNAKRIKKNLTDFFGDEGQFGRSEYRRHLDNFFGEAGKHCAMVSAL